MRLWCHFFGHKLRRPRASQGESNLYTTCKRCDAFFIRGYFDGWQRASASEKAYYLRMYGPKADTVEVGVENSEEQAPTG